MTKQVTIAELSYVSYKWLSGMGIWIVSGKLICFFEYMFRHCSYITLYLSQLHHTTIGDYTPYIAFTTLL